MSEKILFGFVSESENVWVDSVGICMHQWVREESEWRGGRMSEDETMCKRGWRKKTVLSEVI